MNEVSLAGCARRCEVVKRRGGESEWGISSNSVVDVPRETITSPVVDNETIVAGLSPVKGAISQSDRNLSNHMKHTH